MSDRFHPWELLTGVSVGAGLIAVAPVSPEWVTILAATGAVAFTLTQKQWVISAVLAVLTWVAIPVWGTVLPDSWNVPTLARYLPEYQPEPAVAPAEVES